MTLEDFFTLSEMKDGLIAPVRVEELVNVMHKEKDCVVLNACDATRQWSTVASSIVATENGDCLDLFIQLDGLWFIDKWLKDVQKFSIDRGDGFAEESIIVLLRALEKLHIDNERSISSGVWITVKNLIGHKSSKVQDLARAIFDSWSHCGDKDKDTQDVEQVDESLDTAIGGSSKLPGGSVMQESSIMVVSPSKQSSTAVDHAVEPASDDVLPSTSSDDFHPENIEDGGIQKSNDQVSSHMNLGLAHVDAGPSVALGPSVVLNPVEEKLPTMKESPCPREGTVSIETCNSSVAEQNNFEGNAELLKANEIANYAIHTSEMKTSQSELVAIDILSAPNKLDARAVSLRAHAADAIDSVMESGLQNKLDSKDSDCCTRTSSHGDVNMLISEPKREMTDCRSTLVLDATDQGECCSSVLQESFGKECIVGKNEDPDSSSSLMEEIGAVDKFKEEAGVGGENLLNASNCSKPARNTKDCRLADMELEYGLVDALEVARKVAKEVEGEAVHYKYSFCSSSSEISGGGIEQPGSPDSINGKEDQFTEGLPVETPNEQNISPKSSPKQGGRFINSENLEAELDNYIPDMEPSQVTEAAQEPEVNAEKGLCDFDLNQEVSDDMDYTANPATAAVSVVSASRPAAAPELPVAPLQFEGTLGWKGSAATSAFRPASPRRISGGGKPLFVEGGCSCSKQRQNFLNIDLNVTEDPDNEISNSVAEKQAPVFLGLSSGESSVEVSPRRSERLILDLNSIGDDGNASPSDRRAERQLFGHQNGHQSPSPTSSSSSMRPTMKNIDLNDSSFCNDSSDHRWLLAKPASESVDAYGSAKPDDPVISLMGTRVEVGRKEFASQIVASLQDSRFADPAALTSLGRMESVLDLGPTASYAHLPMYGFNGLAAGPSMPFSSAMYRPGGSVPCMVDSRGSPVVPHIVTSAPTVSPPYSQPSFFMSLTGQPPGLNGAASSRPSFDLNSGSVKGGNTDVGGLKQLFGHNESKLEEHLGASSQFSSSLGIGQKRKQPEPSWETYPFVNKLQPPWR